MKMKTILGITLSLGASVMLSSAASYTLQTGSAATSNGFANSAGVAFQNSASVSFAGPGIVGFGIFTISDAQIQSTTDSTALIAAFTGFGSSATGTFTAPGLTANRGTFSRNSVGTVGASSFNDAFMYVFVGNGTTYANSTEFAILKTAFKFLSTDDPTPTPIVNTITTANTTLLVGSAATDIRTTGTDASVTPGWKTASLVVIPEPSAALLGAMGALGLLRRRRA